MLLEAVSIPIEDPKNRFSYSVPLYEDTMFILSCYSVPSEKNYGDVVAMFSEIPTELWIGYLASFVIFVTVSYLGSLVLRQRYSSLWMTICAFVDQDNFPSTSKFVSVLSFVVMIAMFFFMSYSTNCMGTDLVTTDTPVVITSYDDIIRRNVTSYFQRVLSGYQQFKRSPVGTKEHTMYQNSVGYQPKSFLGLRDKCIDQSGVLISKMIVAHGSALLWAGYGYIDPRIRFFLAADQHPTKFTTVFLYNAKMVGSVLEKRLSSMQVPQ